MVAIAEASPAYREGDSSVLIVVLFTANEMNLAAPRVAAVWWTAGEGWWLVTMPDQTVFARGKGRREEGCVSKWERNGIIKFPKPTISNFTFFFFFVLLVCSLTLESKFFFRRGCASWFQNGDLIKRVKSRPADTWCAPAPIKHLPGGTTRMMTTYLKRSPLLGSPFPLK